MVKLRLYGSKPTVIFGAHDEALAIDGESGDLNVRSNGDILLKVERDDEQEYSDVAPGPAPGPARAPTPAPAPAPSLVTMAVTCHRPHRSRRTG